MCGETDVAACARVKFENSNFRDTGTLISRVLTKTSEAHSPNYVHARSTYFCIIPIYIFIHDYILAAATTTKSI